MTLFLLENSNKKRVDQNLKVLKEFYTQKKKKGFKNNGQIKTLKTTYKLKELIILFYKKS